MSDGDELGAAREEVVAQGQQGAVARARERVGLGGDHFDEDVVVNPNGLLLLQALRALQSPYCEVDLLGARPIFKPKHSV